MKLSAPTQIVFLIAVVLAVFGIVSYFAASPYWIHAAEAFWAPVAGWAVLTVGCLMKGL